MKELRDKYQKIILNKRQECDFELLINKGFQPLNGFLKEKDYNSVVENMRLENGQLWSMPITLAISEEQAIKLKNESHVLLENETGLIIGLMNISDNDSIYQPDITHEAVKVYGADDDNHPYVKILRNYQKSGKIYNIGGTIEKFEYPPRYDYQEMRLTPEQTKAYFKENNWKKIIGFQTRNPMHRSHFELTKYALDIVGDDARLLLHPVVGITQDCDIDYHLRVKCYRKMMSHYPENKALLSLLPLSMRMAGPREAVWHAQVRKNYGCTHFIVGRDHAGPSYKKKDGSDFYGPYDAQELLMKHAEEIGIEVVLSKLIVYASPKNQEDEPIYSPIDQVDKEKYEIMNISGTKQREMLNNGEELPDWFTFPEIADELKKDFLPQHKKGFCLYFVGLSGSGKSTLANHIIQKINELSNRKVTYLDGDIVRLELSKGLGFSKEDRSTNIRRIGFVCSEVVKHGGVAVAANIAPFEDDRSHNRQLISNNGDYIEIFIKTSLEICEERDVKGLYKLAREGKIKQFTGISDPFEEPEKAQLILDGNTDINDNLKIIIDHLNKKNLL